MLHNHTLVALLLSGRIWHVTWQITGHFADDINTSGFSFVLNGKADFTVKLNSEVREHYMLHRFELYFHFVTHCSDAMPAPASWYSYAHTFLYLQQMFLLGLVTIKIILIVNFLKINDLLIVNFS